MRFDLLQAWELECFSRAARRQLYRAALANAVRSAGKARALDDLPSGVQMATVPDQTAGPGSAAANHGSAPDGGAGVSAVSAASQSVPVADSAATSAANYDLSARNKTAQQRLPAAQLPLHEQLTAAFAAVETAAQNGNSNAAVAQLAVMRSMHVTAPILARTGGGFCHIAQPHPWQHFFQLGNSLFNKALRLHFQSTSAHDLACYHQSGFICGAPAQLSMTRGKD